MHRALADARGRPAQRASAAGHALGIVQHHFAAQQAADEKLAWHMLRLSRSRKTLECLLRHLMSARSHVCEPAASTSCLFCVVFRWEDVNRHRLGSPRPNVDGPSVGDGRIGAGCVPGRQAGGVGHKLATIYTKTHFATENLLMRNRNSLVCRMAHLCIHARAAVVRRGS